MYRLKASVLLYAEHAFSVLLIDPFQAGLCLAKTECTALSAFMTLPFFAAFPAILILWQPIRTELAMARAFLLGARTAAYITRVHLMVEEAGRALDNDLSSFMKELMVRAEPALRPGKVDIGAVKEAIAQTMEKLHGTRPSLEQIEAEIVRGELKTNIGELVVRAIKDEKRR
jgi:hypothetical protein